MKEMMIQLILTLLFVEFTAGLVLIIHQVIYH